MRGFRFCQLRCARESAATALLVLARYPFIHDGSARESANGVEFVIDLAMLPTGDGPAAEAMVLRDLERAISLHGVT